MKRTKKPSAATTSKNPPHPAKPVGQTAEWPHKEVLHGLNLDGVINHLEKAFVENHPAPESARKQLELLKQATRIVSPGHQPVNRDSYSVIDKTIIDMLPDEPTFGEKLTELLAVVWADYRLWQMFALQKPPPEIAVLESSFAVRIWAAYVL